MLANHEAELICDLAETYHVYDWRALPCRTVATLACGLREDSRAVKAITGAKHPTETMLLAAAVDRLSYLVWMQTKDGQKNKHRPKSIVEELMKKKGVDDTVLYDSPEAFEMARRQTQKVNDDG